MTPAERNALRKEANAEIDVLRAELTREVEVRCAAQNEIFKLRAALAAQAETLQPLQVELRQGWWLGHGCPPSGAYGDDGEMQCNACGTDFKREPFEELRAKTYNMRLAAAGAGVEEYRQRKAQAETLAYTQERDDPYACVREVGKARGRCRWHDTEFVEMVPNRPGDFYCALCASEQRVTRNATGG